MKKLLFIFFLVFSVQINYAQEGGTGLDFSVEKYEEIPMSTPILTRSFTNLPKRFSLKAYAPTPGNQMQQPSCVGWASGYGARTIAYAVKNNWKNQKAKINQNTI